MRSDPDGTLSVRQPTLLHDVVPAPKGTATPAAPGLPAHQAVEMALVTRALEPFLAEVSEQREREGRVIHEHMEISLGELIHRQNLQLADLVSKQQARDTTPGLAGNIAQAEQHLDELNRRLETQAPAARDGTALHDRRHRARRPHVGAAAPRPHQPRASRRWCATTEIERIAVREAIKHEEARGWVVESVESENRGFDLISRKPHPHDPKTFVEVRFIEVKGRAWRRGGRPERERVQDRAAARRRLLALRRLQLRRDTRAPRDSRPRPARLEAGRAGRALPPRARTTSCGAVPWRQASRRAELVGSIASTSRRLPAG